MAIAFLVTLIMSGGIDGASFGKGLIEWNLPEGSLSNVLAFLGSSASVLAGMYGTYLGSEKKWEKRDFFNGVMATDAATQVFGTVFISGIIIAVGAVVLNPTGATISKPADLAAMLVPTLGSLASLVMGIALLAAAFAAIMGNTGRSAVFLMAGLDKPTALESKNIKIAAGAIMAAAIVVCFIFGGSPIQVLYFSNVATSIATPVAGLFITLMMWRKDTGVGIKGHKALRNCMTISYIIYAGLMAYALCTAVPKFIGSII
jgi:Mn2+/Fe2+ NRAMP family transporter